MFTILSWQIIDFKDIMILLAFLVSIFSLLMSYFKNIQDKKHKETSEIFSTFTILFDSKTMGKFNKILESKDINRCMKDFIDTDDEKELRNYIDDLNKIALLIQNIEIPDSFFQFYLNQLKMINSNEKFLDYLEFLVYYQIGKFDGIHIYSPLIIFCCENLEDKNNEWKSLKQEFC